MLKARYIYPIIWIGLILYACLTPPNRLPNLHLFKHFDKVVHFGMYWGLSILLIPALLKGKAYNVSYISSFILSVLVGLLMEYLQIKITNGRSAELWDFIADAAGAIIGIVSYICLIKNKKIEKRVFKI